jgi:hypothetical protein
MEIENLTLYASCLAILISIVALLISSALAIKSWHKNRVIYGIEELVIRKLNGSSDDAEDRGYTLLNEKLSSGSYIIESIQERNDNDWAVLLAKIKK